jgi:hypothetical protein
MKLIAFLESSNSNQNYHLLEHHIPHWLKTLLQIIENHPVTLHAKLAHYCFYLAIQSSKSIGGEVSRHIGLSCVDKSIQILTTSSEPLLKNSLCCLNELITCYKSSCSQQRYKIETFVINNLDYNSIEVNEWASRVYAKLHLLHKNNQNTDTWYIYFKNMLTTANQILNDLFEDYEPKMIEGGSNTNNGDISMNEIEEKTTTVQQHSQKMFTKLIKDLNNLDDFMKQSVRRYRSCLLSLGHLFGYSSSGLFNNEERFIINIRVNEILQFLKRIFLLDVKKLITDSRLNAIAKSLCQYLSEIFNLTMDFTNKFFNTLTTNLLTNSNSINFMLTNFVQYLNEPLLSGSYECYFNCISEWISKCGGASTGFYKYSSILLDHLIKTIKPIEGTTLLINNNNNKANNQILSKNLMLNSFQVVKSGNVMLSALKCLQCIIASFSYLFTFNHFEVCFFFLLSFC